MLALKVEMIGDRAAIVLDEAALKALNARVGDVIHLEADGDVVRVTASEPATEDLHARGRAFLKRYHRSFAF